MAALGNELVYVEGVVLSPSSADSINRMQQTPSLVGKINYTGNPEGVVSANPSSLCHDPVSGIVYFKQTGTGNTGWLRLIPPKNNVVIATPIISGIDFKAIGNTLLFTPSSDFIVQSIVIVVDVETLFLGTGIAQIGFNNPIYDNITGASGVDFVPNGANVSNQPIADQSLVVPSGSGIYLNISVGVSATACSGRVFLIGVLI